MIARSEAEEHLRVIRSLMEKATIYRAISAEAAAVGGALAVAASFALGNWWSREIPRPVPNISPVEFIGLWVAVLTITAAANVFFLWRAAHHRGEQFASAGMRMALRALLPSYAVAGIFTLLIASGGGEYPSVVVPVWIICHGLGLLATGHFAPRSLTWLGWAFVAAGLYAIRPTVSSVSVIAQVGIPDEESMAVHRYGAVLYGQQWMACTFGLFHLIYAACTWPRRAQ